LQKLFADFGGNNIKRIQGSWLGQKCGLKHGWVRYSVNQG